MRWLLLFVLLISIPYVLADDTEIYDNWINSGDSISLDNKTFDLHARNGELIATSDQGVVVVNEEDCDLLETLRFCYNETDDTNAGGTRIRLKIYRVEHEIKITRTYSSSTFIIGTEYEVEIEIENTGSETIDEIMLTDVLPPALELTSVSSCTESGNGVQWSDSLRAGQTQDCSYKFIPRAPGTYQTSAKVEYFDGYQDKEFYSTTTSVNPTSFFIITTEMNTTDPEPGEPVRIWINVSNEGDKSTDLKELLVHLPASYKLIDESRTWDVEESTLKWTDETFSSGESAKRYIDFIPRVSGRFDILTLGSYKYRDYLYPLELEKTTLTIDHLNPIITSSQTNGEELSPNEATDFIIYVENPYVYENLTEVTSVVETDLVFVQDGWLEEIIPNGRRRIVDLEFLPPAENISKTYPVHVNITAVTSYGMIVSDTLEYSVSVSPVKLLTLSSSLSSSSVEEGESVTVTVSISNPNNRNYTDVTVRDETDVVMKGATSTIINDLGKKQSVTAYQYTIIAPDVKDDENITIKTTLVYDDDIMVRTITKEQTLLVTPRELDITATLTAESSTVYQRELIPLRLSVSNKDKETVHNLKINFGRDKEFSIGGELYYELDELDPGESYIKENVIFLIPSGLGSNTYEAGNITFEDVDGNTFHSNLNTIGFNIQQNTISQALIRMNKNATINGSNLDVVIRLTNIGNEMASGNLWDPWLNTSVELNPGATIEHGYKILYDEEKTYNLPPTTFGMETDVFYYYSFSNSLLFTPTSIIKTDPETVPIPEVVSEIITKEPVETIEEEPVENLPEAVPATEPEVQILEEEPQRSWKEKLVSIYELIKKVLFWQRSENGGE